MYQLDLNNPKNIYFCGIGGISMSGLAFLLLDAGFRVGGSDRSASDLTARLSKQGAYIFIGQSEENVTPDIDAFVYTAAIGKDHPEYRKAEQLGLAMLTRAELLGQLMKNYRLPIGISGTHGKTTVTSMVSEILLNARKDPTLFVGGILEAIGGNIRIGHSDILVTEACEYTNSFLSFFPKASVILNVEEDHLDFFKDIDDIRHSFNEYAKLNPEDGVVVIGADIEGKDIILKDVKAKVVTFGITKEADYYPQDLSVDELGISHFTLCSPLGQESFSLRVPGKHNIMNACATVALCDFLGINRDVIKETLAHFGGAKRRFEYRGELDGVKVYDDYAHHPSEIRATLTGVAGYPKNKLWCIFQPHTYSRTKAFLEDFAKALSMADAVILADIYAAREKDTLGISSRDLMNCIVEQGTECYYFPSFEEIEKFVKENCTQGDMLITMGAGDVVNIADDLVGK